MRSRCWSPCSLLAARRASAAAGGDPAPYGTNDAGGFRNVLPPGENGLDNFSQILAIPRLDTSLPPHFADQQPLYENLLYGAPTLTEDQIPSYFKDATFGVPPGEVESTIEPRPGVTIVRDKAYGVPHVYGDTRADTMFGAGYAGAAGPAVPDGRAAPHRPRRPRLLPRRLQRRRWTPSQWHFAPYTEADLAKQLDTGAAASTAPSGSRSVEDVDAYVEGINAYVAAANLDPTS